MIPPAASVFFSDDPLGEVDKRGRAIHDDNFILLCNARHERLDFRLPIQLLTRHVP